MPMPDGWFYNASNDYEDACIHDYDEEDCERPLTYLEKLYLRQQEKEAEPEIDPDFDPYETLMRGCTNDYT